MTLILLYCVSFLLIEYLSEHLIDERQRLNFQLYACFILLMVFFGFRGLSVLNDTAHYYQYVDNVFSQRNFDRTSLFHISMTDRFEGGFQIFCRFLGKFISKEPYLIIFVPALIINIAFLHFIKRTSSHIAFCVFVLVASNEMFLQHTATRQGMAVCISFLFYYSFLNKKYVMAVVYGLLAYMFHHSAVALIIPVLFYAVKWNRRNLILIFAISIIVSMNVYVVVSRLGFGDSDYFERSMDYSNTPVAHIIYTIFSGVSLLAYYYVRRVYTDNAVTSNKLFLSFAMTSFILEICSISFQIIGRSSMYFKPYTLVLLVNSIYSIYDRMDRWIVRSAAVILLIAHLAITLYYRNDWFHLIPYSFFDFGIANPNTNFGY